MKRISVFLLIVTLITGMIGCDEVTPTEYDLIVAVDPAGGGTATDETGTSPYVEGTDVSIKAVANAGYEFTGWTAAAGAFADANAEETTFSMPAQDVTVTANFFQGRLICTWHDLDAVRDELGGNYILINDLDSSTGGYDTLVHPDGTGGEGWEPIGTDESPFVGSFYGQGYEIRDLFIHRPDDEFYVGLFGHVGEGGVVQNVGIVNADVTGNLVVGGLVGGADGGTVSNCHATGTMTGNDWVGGLVGGAGEGTVSNCYATGTVTGKNGVGGLVGGIEAESTVSDSYSTGNVIGSSGSWWIGGLVGALNETTVSNCHATGTVTGGTASDSTGGLVGAMDTGSTVSNCYATGTVTGGTGSNSTGGLVGSFGAGSTVSDSYSTGNVIGNSGSWCIGGLVGAIVGGSVSDSYSTGNVIGNSSSWYVGGLVGAIVRGSSVSNSYSSGAVSGTSYVGGLVGYNWESLVTNSFWDKETSGQSDSDGGIGKSTAEMQDIDTFSSATWDIIDVIDASTRNPSYIWNIVDGVTYPFLSWEAVS